VVEPSTEAPEQTIEDVISDIFTDATSSISLEEDLGRLIYDEIHTHLLATEDYEEGREEWIALPHQIPPDPKDEDWDIWGMLGGRGAGKTEGGANYVIEHCRGNSGARVGVGAPTIGDVRDIVIEGPTGILAHADRGEFQYNRTYLELRHRDGGYIKGLGSEMADRWRGHNWTLLWADELASWHPEAWHMARMGLRVQDARAIFTTTPRNRPFLRELMEEENTIIHHATTYDNPHLAARAVRALEARYKGTALGRQELDALIIDAAAGALWNRELLEEARGVLPPGVNLIRVVVGVDPAVSANKNSAETGIIIVGRGSDRRGYVMADLSLKASPEKWGTTTINGYRNFQASKIIGEVNNGGDLVERNLRAIDPHVAFEAVRASRGKAKRAEPVASLYERGIVTHCGDGLEELEDQMCFWEPEEPDMVPCDRMDALVWALSFLFIDQLLSPIITPSEVGRKQSKWRGAA
jgi:phage terminase large subunit-like protein